MSWTREEIEAAFAAYRECAAQAAATGDWRAWADQFTDDARYVEHHFGELRGREAIYDWIQSTMDAWPNSLMVEFPVDWYLIDETRGWVVGGLVLTLATVATLWRFSDTTFHQVEAPVAGQEVVDGVYKFDFPFLADKVVWENTVNAFMDGHPELKVRYIYTGPSELNSKKKTHLLLYVFTESKEEQ